MSDVIPTLNRRGYQMASQSPLVQYWLDAYDGVHPLLDVGCAYGINTFEALERGIPTVAMDPEQRHLDILRERAERNYPSHLVTYKMGSAPNNCSFPDKNFSGILCSEVLHFMTGNEIEESIRIFHKMLNPKGKLIITTLSDKYLGFFDKNRQVKFYSDLQNGIKWPGIVQMDADCMEKLRNSIQSNQVKTELNSIMPDLFQVCTLKQVCDELKVCGFTILYSELGEHGGHMDKEGIAKLSGRSLHIVAEKN